MTFCLWNQRRLTIKSTRYVLTAAGALAAVALAPATNAASPTALDPSIANADLHMFAEPSQNDAEETDWAHALAAAELRVQEIVNAAGMKQPSPTETPPGRTPHLRSWELPPVTVVGEPAANLREEELVGTYAQPRWTATRRFTSTRVYVIPEGKVEVELWARGTFEKDGVDKWRFLQEIEIGLPGRFQLDLYARQDWDSEADDTMWGGQIEVRWALADWGKIWGNPTFYFEYITLDERPDKIEPKILLGGEITERWHWGANFVGEFELGGEKEYEYAFSSGVSYTVVDSKFSIGAEGILSLTDVEGDRGNYTTSLVIGPDIQWKPLPALTINIAPLIGVTHDSPHLQLFINAGWEF